MPPLANVPEVIRITTRISDGSDLNAINRFFMRYAGAAPTFAQLSTFNNAIATGWAADMASAYTTSSVLEEVITTDLTSATSAESDNAFAVGGSRAGNGLAAGTALVMQLGIVRRYRGGHPRQYLSVGVDTDLSTRQLWQGAFLTGILANYQAWMGAIQAAVWPGGISLTPVNVSYFEGFTNFTFPSGRTRAIPKPRVGGPVVDPIVSYSVNTHVASQRRRNLQSA